MATLKQQKVVAILSENVGISTRKAMKMAGYREQTSNTPQRLTNSRGYKELMKQYLPAKDLFKAHRDALTADKWNDFTGEREADHRIRLDAAKAGYKVYGIGEPHQVANTQINVDFGFGGYIPPNNNLGLTPTLEVKKPTDKT